jgi:hypothetical protein
MECGTVLTFCVRSEEDDVAKHWSFIFHDIWCVSLGSAEGEGIALF